MEDDILNFMKINVDQMSGPFTRRDSLVIYGEFYIRQLGTIAGDLSEDFWFLSRDL